MDITSQVDEGKIINLVFFEYSKAFDVVRHIIYSSRKLLELSIDGTILSWISGFLINRAIQF